MAKFEKGYIMSQESRQKISEARKAQGDTRTPEHKQKMIDAVSNRTHEQKTLAQLKRKKTQRYKQLKVNNTAEVYSQIEELECRIAEMEENQ